MDHQSNSTIPQNPGSEEARLSSVRNKKLISEDKKNKVDTSTNNEEPSKATANNKEKNSQMNFNFDDFLKDENFPIGPGLLSVSFEIFCSTSYFKFF